MSRERRQFDRLKVHQPSNVEIAGETHSVIVSNLSKHGVCFHSPQELEGEGKLFMAVPGIQAEREFEIVYKRPSGGDFTIGARFTKDSEEHPMNNILRYLASKQEFEGMKFNPSARPFFGDRAPS